MPYKGLMWNPLCIQILLTVFVLGSELCKIRLVPDLPERNYALRRQTKNV
jgi:hypothetical protein